MAESNWTIPVGEWKDETAFIVAGGLSVEKQNLKQLSGRKVIVINSSYEKLPRANYLFSMDGRWLRHHQAPLARIFKGVVVTNSASVTWPGLRILKRVAPPGLSSDPTATAGKRTSLHGAINLAVLLGSKRLVLLGADGGGVQYNGRTHHHSAHPWYIKKGCWDEQLADLRTTVQPLKDLGVEVLNCSPGTVWPIWPIVRTLEETL